MYEKASTACLLVLSLRETRQINIFVNRIALCIVFTDAAEDLLLYYTYHPGYGCTNYV